MALTLPEWLERAVHSLQNGDVEGWMKIYAPDAIHEFPFALPNSPSRLVGVHAIECYLRTITLILRFGQFTWNRGISIGDELIVAGNGHHYRRSDGIARDVESVWFIKCVGGKVTHLRDYINSAQLSEFF